MTAALLPLARLPADFRALAEQARDVAAAEGAARAYEKAAAIVEERLQDAALEPLTLEEAEFESGYTKNHLRRLIREGVIPNAARSGEPTILRMHVPRKPGYAVARTPQQPALSRTQAARAVVEGD